MRYQPCPVPFNQSDDVRAEEPASRLGPVAAKGRLAVTLRLFRNIAQLWRISVPSTFRHSRMKAASAVQPLADTMVPST